VDLSMVEQRYEAEQAALSQPQTRNSGRTGSAEELILWRQTLVPQGCHEKDSIDRTDPARP
jgi:hypothetical protein